MTMEAIVNRAGIPIVLFVICVYYGLRLLITQDIKLIWREGKRFRDEKEYARRAGMMVLFYAAGTLIMAVLLFVNTVAAVMEIVLWTVVMGIGWKIMSDRYGQ